MECVRRSPTAILGVSVLSCSNKPLRKVFSLPEFILDVVEPFEIVEQFVSPFRDLLAASTSARTFAIPVHEETGSNPLLDNEN